MNTIEMNTKEEVKKFDEYKKIVNALKPYFEGGRKGDGQLMVTAFYDHAHVVGSMDGEFMNANMEDFGKGMDSFGAANDMQYHIAWIDISGPAAAVKLEITNWVGFRFTDFFAMYKKDGEWKISAKVYDSHSRN
ncbi:nuclear transport factor 2 family protein [Spongiimicrobium salis]|uniref:nuclear transport factor 2 family protein n=1 Tax=Spongiimicrobium salis TaxID=1667022 RepID=UPI00374DAA65